MDFALSSEQLLIKNSVDRFAAETYRPGVDHWPAFAELGWLGVGAPEDLGGFGGPLETAILMEAFGRGLVIEPYVAQVVLAAGVLREAGRRDLLESAIEGRERFALAFEERGAAYDPSMPQTTATREDDGYVLRGQKVRVLDGANAGTLLVSTRDGDGVTLFALDPAAPGVTRRDYRTEDGHGASQLHLDGVRVTSEAVVGDPGGGLRPLEAALDHAVAALCAEAVGLMGVMHELTLGYLKAREQFGVPIGSFQALQHRMAEMFVELELARSMSYVAALTLANAKESERKRAISAAKVQIARSGRFVGQNAIQLHGAIGMTEEYKIGGYFKRMTTIERLLGDSDYHTARFIAARQPVRETIGSR